jgi:hypothetical protein
MDRQDRQDRKDSEEIIDTCIRHEYGRALADINLFAVFAVFAVQIPAQWFFSVPV